MRVISLEAENVKRLVALDIELDGTLQVIGGRNGQGKSSVMDAIWLTLGGGTASRETKTVRPVRDGTDGARAVVNLGDLVVTRTWKPDGASTVKVTTPDGAAYKSPQRILDELTARIGIDPLAFTLLSDADQVRALLDLVELPFDPAKLDAERKGLYDRRTEANRLVKEYRGRLADYPEPPADLPAEEVSVADLMDELGESERLLNAVERAENRVDDAQADVERLERELEEARVELQNSEDSLDRMRGGMATTRDPETIRAEINSASTVNRAVIRERERQRGVTALELQEQTAQGLTDQMERLDQRRRDGLAQAKFPVDGLGFEDGVVTFNGVPFKQASSAEQIRVSVAMGMALNPKLRTLFIRDGSLLDAENMQLLADMAGANNYQIIVERVGTTDVGAIIIEDGQVAP